MNDPANVMFDIINKYKNHSKWDNARLGAIKTLSNSYVGSIGQDFVCAWCKVRRLRYERSEAPQSPWDAKINGITFEIKTATEDTNGNFQFNHIRHHRPYEALLCIGIQPNDVLFNAWPKGKVAEGKAGKLVTMDKGSSATFKLSKKPSDMLPLSKFKSTILQLT